MYLGSFEIIFQAFIVLTAVFVFLILFRNNSTEYRIQISQDFIVFTGIQNPFNLNIVFFFSVFDYGILRYLELFRCILIKKLRCFLSGYIDWCQIAVWDGQIILNMLLSSSQGVCFMSNVMVMAELGSSGVLSGAFHRDGQPCVPISRAR